MNSVEIRTKIERIQVSSESFEKKQVAIKALESKLANRYHVIKKQIEDGKSDPIPTD